MACRQATETLRSSLLVKAIATVAMLFMPYAVGAAP
jgi:hypothetical protein